MFIVSIRKIKQLNYNRSELSISTFKKYIVYLFRWQLSTPIITLVMAMTPNTKELYKIMISNLVGGIIFFWIDKLIFKKGDYMIFKKQPININNNQCQANADKPECSLIEELRELQKDKDKLNVKRPSIDDFINDNYGEYICTRIKTTLYGICSTSFYKHMIEYCNSMIFYIENKEEYETKKADIEAKIKSIKSQLGIE